MLMFFWVYLVLLGKSWIYIDEKNADTEIIDQFVLEQQSWTRLLSASMAQK